ncbi:hypothetical protein FBU30_009149 [Linnemannia zychae]|nr:hypothetical protein FBU30_009149 [Linnemannia zychae]
MSDVGMYIGIAAGCIVLLGISGGILYRKHRQEVLAKEAFEQQAQERLQQVADLNLPPFYADHERDPVCIYEHELPPDILPSVQPIFVQAASNDDSGLILPEEDPLYTGPRDPEVQSPYSIPLTSQADSGIGATGNPFDTPVVDPTRHGGYFDPSNMPTPPPLAAAALGSSHPPAPSSPLSHTSSSSQVPRTFINQEMLNRARVRAPPDYDTPNVVVDRSPLYHPSTHSLSPYSEGSRLVQEGYFSNVRIRAHTFSHSPSSHTSFPEFLRQLQQQHLQQNQGQQQHPPPEETRQEGVDSELSATPRYSAEFPSSIPHEQILEEHQRSRALYDQLTLVESSHSSLSFPLQSPVSFSSASSSSPRTSSHTSSPLLPLEPSMMAPSILRRQGSRGRGGLRLRASTLGESSRGLIQRVHSLLRHSTSASNGSSPMMSPHLGDSHIVPMEGSLHAATHSVDVSMIGLGLELEERGTLVSQETHAQEQGQDQVTEIESEVQEGENNDMAEVQTCSVSTIPSGRTLSMRSSISADSLSLTISDTSKVSEDAHDEEENGLEGTANECVSKSLRQQLSYPQAQAPPHMPVAGQRLGESEASAVAEHAPIPLVVS